MISLKAGAPVYLCPCGLDPVEGWGSKLGVSATHFVHCPDCDRWAYGVTEAAAQVAWNAQAAAVLARLGATPSLRPIVAWVA